MPHETDSEVERSWQSITTPFDVDLYDVVQTDDGLFAAGGGGTIVANRGEGWEVVVDSGPADQNSTLRSIATTGNGTRIWFAGASGAIGVYDLIRNRKYDFSYSKDISDSWQSIAAFGTGGSETVFVANASGTVLEFSLSGLSATVRSPSKPGSGASIPALAATGDGLVYAADTAGDVYEKRPEEWTAIGIADVQATLNDVTVGPRKRVYVAAGNGTVYRYDPTTEVWEPIEVPAAGLRAVACSEDHLLVMSESNTVFRRPLDGRTTWRRESTPTGNDLLAVAPGYPDIAVGKAGTVIERPPRTAPMEGNGPPRADPCERLETELLERLDRAELEYLLRHSDCESSLFEVLDRRTVDETVSSGRLEGTDGVSLVVLPVADAIGTAGRSTRHRRSGCECAESESALEDVLLERLLCE